MVRGRGFAHGACHLVFLRPTWWVFVSQMGAQLMSMENLLAKVGDKRVRSSNYLLPNVGVGGAPLPLRWCTPHTGAA